MTSKVLITGGASGLGLALAKQYLATGASVCICDLNEQAGQEALNQLKIGDNDVTFLRCDITSESDIAALASHTHEQWGRLDILVNNAGVATGGALEYEDIEQWEWVLNINLLGLVRLTRAFVPLLEKGKQAKIINIASQAGLTPIPVMGSYNASKAAVVSFSETMHLELCHKGIQVSVACPSFFATNLDKSLRTKQPGIAKLLGKLFTKSDISAEQVAGIITTEADKGRFMILTHKTGKTAYRLKRYLTTRRYMNMMKDKTKQLGNLSD